MHCAEPGCLVACPAPGAIVQYANGIVDFQQDQCIGCGYCMTGCPFNVPKFSRRHAARLQVHAVRRSRAGACSRRASRPARPAACSSAPRTTCCEIAEHAGRSAQGERFRQAAVYDPPGVGGTGVVTVLAFGDQPELYGLPRDPVVPLAVRLWKGPLKWTRQPRHARRARRRRRRTTCATDASARRAADRDGGSRVTAARRDRSLPLPRARGPRGRRRCRTSTCC